MDNTNENNINNKTADETNTEGEDKLKEDTTQANQTKQYDNVNDEVEEDTKEI